MQHRNKAFLCLYRREKLKVRLEQRLEEEILALQEQKRVLEKRHLRDLEKDQEQQREYRQVNYLIMLARSRCHFSRFPYACANVKG